MQKSSLFSVALLLGLGLVSSAEADHQKVKIGGDISLLTKYIGGTSGSSFCDDPVAQMGVYLRHKNGFWGGFGLSQSPFSTNDDGGDEEDLLIGYNGRKGAIYYDLGYSYYNLQSLSETSGDLHNLSVGLSSDVNGVAPYVNLSLQVPTDSEVLDGGALYQAGVCKKVLLLGREIGADLSIGGHDGANGKDPELVSYGRLGFSVPVKTIALKLNLQKSFGGQDSKAGNEVWGGVVYEF